VGEGEKKKKKRGNARTGECEEQPGVKTLEAGKGMNNKKDLKTLCTVTGVTKGERKGWGSSQKDSN